MSKNAKERFYKNQVKKGKISKAQYQSAMAGKGLNPDKPKPKSVSTANKTATTDVTPSTSSVDKKTAAQKRANINKTKKALASETKRESTETESTSKPSGSSSARESGAKARAAIVGGVTNWYKSGVESEKQKNLATAQSYKKTGDYVSGFVTGSYKKGGVVKKTGLAKVHKGERVLTKKQNQTYTIKLRNKK